MILIQFNGLTGSAELGFQSARTVNSLWPNPRLMIVLHSPSGWLIMR
jgi:hypothetical protein